MPIPLLVIAAAGLGVQGLRLRNIQQTTKKKKQATIDRTLTAIGRSVALGLIDPKRGLVLELQAMEGDVDLANSQLNAALTAHATFQEQQRDNVAQADSVRIQQEDRAKVRAETKRMNDAALNPELQTALSAAGAFGTAQVDTNFGIDAATGRPFSAPKRNTPDYIKARDSLRDNQRGLDNVNRLHDLIVSVEGSEIDPASPVVAEMKNRFETLLAFGRKEQNLGTPSGKETARLERANPSGASFVNSLTGSYAATLASLTVTQQTLKQTAQNQLRDTRNFGFDQEDTFRSLDLINEAANQIEVAGNVIGSDKTRAFGAQGEDPEASVTKFGTGVGVAVELAKLAGRPDLRRLRFLQETAMRIFGDPDVPFIIPDVLPKELREFFGASAEVVDLPFVD